MYLAHVITFVVAHDMSDSVGLGHFLWCFCGVFVVLRQGSGCVGLHILNAQPPPQSIFMREPDSWKALIPSFFESCILCVTWVGAGPSWLPRGGAARTSSSGGVPLVCRANIRWCGALCVGPLDAARAPPLHLIPTASNRKLGTPPPATPKRRRPQPGHRSLDTGRTLPHRHARHGLRRLHGGPIRASPDASSAGARLVAVGNWVGLFLQRMASKKTHGCSPALANPAACRCWDKAAS